MSKVVEIYAQDNSVIERDATANEIAQRELDALEAQQAKLQEANAKAENQAAKSALLERLGITAEEAALLLS